MHMDVASYNAIIDTAILILLLAWAVMDRCNIYIKKKDDKHERPS